MRVVLTLFSGLLVLIMVEACVVNDKSADEMTRLVDQRDSKVCISGADFSLSELVLNKKTDEKSIYWDGFNESKMIRKSANGKAIQITSFDSTFNLSRIQWFHNDSPFYTSDFYSPTLVSEIFTEIPPRTHWLCFLR